MAKLIIVRGLPGSGKTTYAKKRLAELQSFYGENNVSHREADMYFLDSAGHYKFDRSAISRAHSWCKELTYATLCAERHAIVSNTFTKNGEMHHYFEMALAFNAELEIVEMTGNYGSIHEVPQATIDKMRKRWEEVDESLLVGLNYTITKVK